MRTLMAGCFGLALLACAGGGGGGDTSSPDGGASSGTSGTSGGTTTTGTIAAAEFDQACAVDEDCSAIHEGDPCNSCKCQNAAIAKKDLQKYENELATRSKTCGTPAPCAADCINPGAYCNAGKCALDRRPRDGGS